MTFDITKQNLIEYLPDEVSLQKAQEYMGATARKHCARHIGQDLPPS